MDDDISSATVMLFTEFQFCAFYPDVFYIQPGDEITTGIVVRDFDDLGEDAKIFGFNLFSHEIRQLVPVRITDSSGEICDDVWQATISV